MLNPFTSEGRFECGLDEIVKGKIWTFVAVSGGHGGLLGVAVANERGYHPIPKHWCSADSYQEMERHVDQLNEAEGIDIPQATKIVVSSMVRPTKPYTVIFYVDGDKAMETFVQHVDAIKAGDAFDLAVAKAKKDGGTNSGYSLCDYEWEGATEIATYDGHLTQAAYPNG